MKRVLIEPMLCAPSDEIPKGDWSYEIKWDGVRCIAQVDELGRVRLFTRHHHSITTKYPHVARYGEDRLPINNAIIDGELVAFDSDGRPDFRMAIQNDADVVFIAFDLLRMCGANIMHLPYRDRRAMLEKVVPTRYNSSVTPSGKTGAWVHSPTFADGDALHAATESLGLEGIVAKRNDQPYRCGKRSWVKIKHTKRQEFVAYGYTPGEGSRALGAVKIGYYDDNGVMHDAGKVGTGFRDRDCVELMDALDLGDLVIEVEFLGWTINNHVRLPVFKGIRDDKLLTDVRKET